VVNKSLTDKRIFPGYKMAMPRPSTAPVRKQVSLPVELAKAVNDFRFGNRFTSESEAIRRLIELGLKVAAKPQSAQPPAKRKSAS
jgi:hypothetical protein